MIDLPAPNINYSLCSDDGQTADDEGSIDRTSYKLGIPSIRRMRKPSPTPTRRNTETEKRAPRDRKRKGMLGRYFMVTLFINL